MDDFVAAATEDRVFLEEDPDEDNFDLFNLNDYPDVKIQHEISAPVVDDLTDANHAHLINAAANSLMGIREDVRAGQAAQAVVMTTRSRKVLSEVQIGDYVTLPIPDVDRCVASATNLICSFINLYDT